jgi:hypothetical protein
MCRKFCQKPLLKRGAVSSIPFCRASLKMLKLLIGYLSVSKFVSVHGQKKKVTLSILSQNILIQVGCPLNYDTLKETIINMQKSAPDKEVPLSIVVISDRDWFVGGTSKRTMMFIYHHHCCCFFLLSL